ncbi:MAG: MurR/RpiR family transcriptional regulator [Spirochaetales bacterium]|nr:MurR/RpiR family transcriptional regulator [Spirochaetales bacterium]
MKGNLSSKGGCILRIKGIYEDLKPAEKRVGEYVLQHAEEVIDFTIEDLATKCDSSYATITRFCKRAGYSGYKELKSGLINDIIRDRGVDDLIYNLSITSDPSTESIAEKIYTLGTNVLEDSYKIMDPTVIDAAADRILHAGSICFIGAGYSGISARYAYSKFFRIGIPCFSELDSTLYRMKISIMTDNDVLFAISSSGRTRNIIDAVKLAKKNNVTVVSLSDFAISPLTRISDFNLHTTPRNANLFMNIDMPLVIGQIAIIDVLYSCCCIRLAEKASESHKKTKASADAEKTR